jgi:2-polyprenyl-6-hydroxyphenyl methylase/3-demethylubiquinone-9 3-methyltransferase
MEHAMAGPADSEAPEAASVDRAELAKFAALASRWWDPAGQFAPLHRLNPVRLAFVRDRAAARFCRDPRAPRPLAGLRLLDIGCGGGLLAEPLARLGASVTAVDAAARNIAVARLHAEQAGLAIDYRVAAAETLAEAGERFDIVLAMEVIEHVADLDAFIGAAVALLAPGGLLFLATINRTAKAFALAVVGAEYVLRWLPRGTHDWRRFVRPSELAAALRRHGAAPIEIRGVAYQPLADRWALSADLDVNYMMVSRSDDRVQMTGISRL